VFQELLRSLFEVAIFWRGKWIIYRNPDFHVVHAGFTPEQKAGSEAML